VLRKILCDDFDFGIFVRGDGNLLERNYCQGNTPHAGISAFGANTLNHNQGRNNGGQGVVAGPGPGGAPAQTDRRNYGSGNDDKPDCTINGLSVPGTGGRYC
jgi:hypothetical protein